MTTEQVIFFILATITVVAALGMVSVASVFHAALLMILAFTGIAALYMLLGAGFLGIIQILIYVGAIAVLMLFAIMLTPNQVDLSGGTTQGQKISAALTAITIGTIAVGVVITHPWNLRPTALNEETAERIGMLLLNTYVLPFWIASILLTVGLIGAIVIAREE